MNLSKTFLGFVALLALAAATGCKVPALVETPAIQAIPAGYGASGDTANSGQLSWRNYFSDPYLLALVDTALKNNQELAITLQEVEMAKNDIQARQGRLLPAVDAGIGAGIEKVGRYTSQGAGDASTEITKGKEVPEWLPDYGVSAVTSWEADIWHKLRNEKKAAMDRYLATVEGKNFVVTGLVAEIVNSYYELLSLDNQLSIVKETIGLQQNALEIVKVQKQAARATELAVKKFEAEVLNSQSLEYDIRQRIQETENRINFLAGKFPQPVIRDTSGILNQTLRPVSAGMPSQLLGNRPDIKQAEWELSATRLDVKAARAEFYPSFNMSAVLGFQAFRPDYLVRFPESLLASLAGDLAGPLVNKKAIRAEYLNANARQIQALYHYERNILNGYIEVSTQLSAIQNLQQVYDLKSKEVDTLQASIEISNELFKSARADYLEVLLTQRDALDAKLELVETRLRQFNAMTNIYRSLGGGWR